MGSTASHSVRLYLNTVLVHVHYDEAKEQVKIYMFIILLLHAKIG